MNNLLIIGAGTYADVAAEIARDMGDFDKISFLDDNKKETPNGEQVIGTTNELKDFLGDYSKVIIAIGNPECRLALLKKIESVSNKTVATLISPRAYISPSAKIEAGCIVEPMAVIHTGCYISKGCIVSAGAVINHASVCQEGVHVDCNATVVGYMTVPKHMKVISGSVYAKEKE